MSGSSGSSLEDRLRGHVAHALGRLLTPDELDGRAFRWQVEAGGDHVLLAVDLSARGERFTGFVWHGGAHESMQGLDTFADGLEDFIAESRFAWGQQRLLRDRPWRTGE